MRLLAELVDRIAILPRRGRVDRPNHCHGRGCCVRRHVEGSRRCAVGLVRCEVRQEPGETLGKVLERGRVVLRRRDRRRRHCQHSKHRQSGHSQPEWRFQCGQGSLLSWADLTASLPQPLPNGKEKVNGRELLPARSRVKRRLASGRVPVRPVACDPLISVAGIALGLGLEGRTQGVGRFDFGDVAGAVDAERAEAVEGLRAVHAEDVTDC